MMAVEVPPRCWRCTHGIFGSRFNRRSGGRNLESLVSTGSPSAYTPNCQYSRLDYDLATKPRPCERLQIGKRDPDSRAAWPSFFVPLAFTVRLGIGFWTAISLGIGGVGNNWSVVYAWAEECLSAAPRL